LEVAQGVAKPLDTGLPIGGALGHENGDIEPLLSQDLNHLMPFRAHRCSAADRVKPPHKVSGMPRISVEN
jgi:hypothetical protein